MKLHIFNRNLLLGVAATCCCLALLGPKPIVGSQFAITGQFMGTKNIDGEQVLLFKLPKSISSQVDEPSLASAMSSPPHQQQEARTQNLQSQMVYGPSYQSNQNLNYRTRLLQPADPTPAELSGFSLSVPSIPEQASSSTGSMYSPMPQLVARRPAITSKLESTLADILSFAESNNNDAVAQAIEQTDISGSNQSLSLNGANANEEEEQQQQQQQHPEQTAYVDPSSSVEQQMSQFPRPISSNLTSIETQLRQLLLHRQPAGTSYSNSSTETLLANNATTPQELNHQHQEARLWLSPQRQPQLHQDHDQPNNLTTLGHHNYQQQVPGILGKLASSSPELLLRLRSLLRRAAIYSQPGNSSTHYFDSTASAANSSSVVEDEDRKYDGHDKALLHSFLTSQNLSSHDEIKIPLVVIAMPRVISLKRNQYGANQARQGATTGGLWETGATTTASSLSPSSGDTDGSQATAVAALKQLLAELSANMTQTKLPVSRLITYPARPHLQHLGSESERPLVPSTTTDYQGPRHTMAPYARHFNEPPPSAHQAYQQQQQQGVINRLHLAGGYSNNLTSSTTPTLTTPSLAGSTGQLLYPGSGHTTRLQYFEPTTNSSLFDDNHLSSLAVGRLFRGAQLGSSNLRQRLTADQLNVEQQKVNLALNRRGRQPSLTQEAPLVYADAPEQSLYYPGSSAAPALPLPAFLSYLGAVRQPRSFNSTSSLHNFADNPQVQGQQQHPGTASALVEVGVDELAAAQNRDSLLFEHSLSKLRPLFRAGATSATSSKLTSNQMLSLMSTASLARRQDQQDAAAAARSWRHQLLTTEHGQPMTQMHLTDTGRKSPEMMLMIV